MWNGMIPAQLLLSPPVLHFSRARSSLGDFPVVEEGLACAGSASILTALWGTQTRAESRRKHARGMVNWKLSMRRICNVAESTDQSITSLCYHAFRRRSSDISVLQRIPMSGCTQELAQGRGGAGLSSSLSQGRGVITSHIWLFKTFSPKEEVTQFLTVY